MPNIIQRYIFKEFFTATFISVFLFVFVLIVGNAIKEVLPLLASGKITWLFFSNIMIRLIPSMVAYALPLGLLTATLIVLGKLSSNNELVAMRAAGISLLNIISPIILITILATVFSISINYYYGPSSITYYRSALANVIRQNPLKFIQSGTFVKDFPGYIFFIEKKENEWVENCWIWELNSSMPSGINLLMHSNKGYLRYDCEKDNIVLTLIGGIAEKYSEKYGEFGGTHIVFQNTSISLPLKNLLGSNTFYKKIGYMSLPELLQERYKINKNDPATLQRKISIQLEIQKNAVMAFATLALVLIAIPLGIKVGRSETSANIAVAVALALAYYFVVMAISWLESKPYLRPDILVWIPNILFQTTGIFFILKKS